MKIDAYLNSWSDFPLVSVIIPSYNHQNYIEKAIKSVINQEYRNIELIVIDDGSVDNSFEIIKKLKRKYNFEFFYRKNLGLIKTLNQAIDIAKGKYICFLASDDFFLPKRVSNAVAFFNKQSNDTAMIYCDGYIVDELDHKKQKFSKKFSRPLFGSNRSNLIIGNWIPACGTTYRRDILKKFKYSTLYQVEDYYIYLNLFYENKFKFKFYSAFDFCYRKHNFNTSNNFDYMLAQDKKLENRFIHVKKFRVFKRNIKALNFRIFFSMNYYYSYLFFLQITRFIVNKSNYYFFKFLSRTGKYFG